MADVANANGVSVSKDLSDNNVPSECSDTNKTKSPNQNQTQTLGYQEIDSFSDLSFKTGDDISLQDLIESEFAARISSLSAETSPCDEIKPGLDELDEIQELLDFEQKQTTQTGDCFDLLNIDDHSKPLDLNGFLSGPLENIEEIVPGDCEIGPSPDVVSNNGTPTTEPDLVVFKITRPTEMPVISSFDPFARIEEDSDCSNSNPMSAPNQLNSPDEFPFPESPQDGQPVSDEPMVDLFVKTVSDENLSDPAQNDFSRFNTSSVESVNNSFPNMSDLQSPDRADHDEFFSDDLISSEPVETVVDQDEGTSSVSHHVDLSTEETETGLEDQSLHQLEQTGDDWIIDKVIHKPPEDEPPERGREELEEELISNIEVVEAITPIVEETIEDDPVSCEDAVTPVNEKVNEEEPEYARMMAPIAVEEDTDEWTTVEAALERVDDEKGGVAEEEGLIDVGCVDNNVTNARVDVVINAPDILVVPAEVADAATNGTDEDSSETETNSDVSSSEKRTTKKKKTTSTESGTKRTKKTNKSEEKENISVEPMVTSTDATESLSLISHSASASDADDLLNVSVRDIMQTYCSEATKSFENKIMIEEIIPSPVPIQNLKARSMVDLSSSNPANKVTALRCNLVESVLSRSTNNLTSFDKCPVVTGVSVRALKERYCSMVNLTDKTELSVPVEPRRRLSVPWSESLKSSFSKFDQLSKKTVIHVRSVDSSKAQKQFADATAGNEVSSNCKSCGKMVFQMEQVKAERAVWHKNCFRCKECSKQLTLDTYSSHEGVVYCKPHFKELFKPKAVIEDEEPIRLRKPEMIIRENQPMELPPEVVRASDKPDLGLEELQSLNVRSRFQVFEKGDEEGADLDRSPSSVNVKRSPSILSKLAKFQKKGMDIGVTDDSLNGAPYDQSPSSTEEEEEEEEDETTNRKVVKSKKIRERPVSFGKMDDVKSVWENGVAKTKEELREERKQEIQQIRSRLFMGKQVKMKEAYEQAVRESESTEMRNNGDRKDMVTIRSDKARSIKECFEKGEPLNVDDEEGEGDVKDTKKLLSDDTDVFEAGISKKSRSLFLELDKSASKSQIQNGPKPAPRTTATPTKPREVVLKRQPSDDIVRSSDTVEEVTVNSAEIGSKFKFFETFKPKEVEKKKFRITPPREGQTKDASPEPEIYRDPNVVRAADRIEPEIVRTNTTTKMLSLFRQLEERTEEVPDGPKPLKCFTPPPDYKEGEETQGSEDESEEEEEESEEEVEEGEVNPNLVRASDKVEDDYLKQSASAARAKQLRAKFEKWEEKELEREQSELKDRRVNGTTNVELTENNESVEVTSIECTKNLRARFESMRNETEPQKDKVNRPKVNRFVEIHNSLDSSCEVCQTRVYPLERVETSGKIFHKSCFRCVQCNCLLRLETFTLNCGRLYCMPHFRQLFTVKGNYDEGFGVDQHKTKWRIASTC